MPEKTTKQIQRAESRERRRSNDTKATEEATEPQQSGDGDGFDAREAVGAAAVAGVIGATVGALRALSTHRNELDEDDVAEEPDAKPQPTSDEDDTPEPADDDGAEGDSDAESPPQAEPAAGRPSPPADDSRKDQRTQSPARTSERGADRSQVREIVRRAREDFNELHGAQPESLSSLLRTDHGWLASLEVVEVHRVPDSTDVLASYRLELDPDGNLVRYERVRRYYRSQADAGGDS